MPDNTGQVGGGQVGYEQVGAGGGDNTINPTGFTRRAFGTPGFSANISFDGFTQRAFGTPIFQEEISFTGFTRRAFGAVRVRDSRLPVDGFTRRAFGSPTIQQEISLSGFTRRAFGTPTCKVNQQLDFFLRGIFRRAFGVPGLTGGVQGIRCFMGGVDVTGYLQRVGGWASAVSYTRQLNTTGTCGYGLIVPVGDSFRPTPGMSILIQENNQTKFAGYVDHFDKTALPWASTLAFTVGGVDKMAATQRRIIAHDFTAGTALYDACTYICSTSMSGEGIDPGGVDRALVLLDDFAFKYVKVQDALKQLADALDCVWWIDNFGVLWMQRPANLQASAFVAEDGSSQQLYPGGQSGGTSLVETESIANYRNKQYVRTSNQVLTVQLNPTHTFSGVPGDIVCITDYPLTAAPTTVKENGVELVGTPRLFELKLDGTLTNYPPGGDGYYWAKGFWGIWHWPSQNPPPAGTTLSLGYSGVSTFAANVVAYTDAAEIARMAAAMPGGSGIFEEVEDYPGGASYAMALALAQGIEQATAPPPKQLVATTIQPIEDVGRKVTINLSEYGIVGTYIIQQLNATDIAIDSTQGRGTAFQTKITLVQARTQGNWINSFERLMARLGQAQVPQSSENPTWALAFDSPGSLSPGLAVGAFGSPYPIQTSQGRIAYVSAVFQDAPGSPIVIDILLNGVSIFDGSKLRYGPGDSPNVRLYGNFVPSSITTKQGDKLTLNVVSVDALAPGKNGTVIVVVVPA